MWNYQVTPGMRVPPDHGASFHCTVTDFRSHRPTGRCGRHRVSDSPTAHPAALAHCHPRGGLLTSCFHCSTGTKWIQMTCCIISSDLVRLCNSGFIPFSYSYELLSDGSCQTPSGNRIVLVFPAVRSLLLLPDSALPRAVSWILPSARKASIVPATVVLP